MTRKPRSWLAPFALFLPLFWTGCQPATDAEAPSSNVEAQVPLAPAPDPADVESVEAIVHAVYEVISGDAGTARNWDRWRSLFLPEAQLHPVGATQGGGHAAGVMTPEEFVQNTDSVFTADGFYEIEIGHVTETYGNIAHRFSSYASFRSSEETEAFNRGINSFQLLNDGERWWVLSIFWQHEPDAGPIPAKYLTDP